MDFIHLFIVFLVVNFFSFFLMGLDKRKAIKGQFRISEKILFMSALPFSSYGFTLGMKWFRHKTKKTYFKWSGILLMILHSVFIIYINITHASINGLFH